MVTVRGYFFGCEAKVGCLSMLCKSWYSNTFVSWSRLWRKGNWQRNRETIESVLRHRQNGHGENCDSREIEWPYTIERLSGSSCERFTLLLIHIETLSSRYELLSSLSDHSIDVPCTIFLSANLGSFPMPSWWACAVVGPFIEGCLGKHTRYRWVSDTFPLPHHIS